MDEIMTDKARTEIKSIIEDLNKMKNFDENQQNFIIGFATCLAYMPMKKQEAQAS